MTPPSPPTQSKNRKFYEYTPMIILDNPVKITDTEFRQLRDLIYQRFGISLGDHKQSLVVGRLNKVLKQLGITDFQQYYKYVTSDESGQSLATLIDKISTNHTFFYREPDHYRFFQEKVLPEMANRLKSANLRDLHIWCPGCSSGEEPYVLAMLILEFFGNNIRLWDPAILATDISARVLKIAETAVYTRENVSHLPQELKRKYFKPVSDDSFALKDNVKNMVLFRRLNLMRSDFPFKGKFHVIFCRNVMIYFDKDTRNTLVKRFYRYTHPGGYLFIGHSESLGRNDANFNYIKPAVYQRESS